MRNQTGQGSSVNLHLIDTGRKHRYACGMLTEGRQGTFNPKRVTCGRCWRTVRYKGLRRQDGELTKPP